MKEANKKGNCNVYLVERNYKGEITEKTLIATFRSAAWALIFMQNLSNSDKRRVELFEV